MEKLLRLGLIGCGIGTLYKSRQESAGPSGGGVDAADIARHLLRPPIPLGY